MLAAAETLAGRIRELIARTVAYGASPDEEARLEEHARRQTFTSLGRRVKSLP